MVVATARLTETFGGARVLRRASTLAALESRVKEGLPYRALTAVAERYAIPLRELMEILDLPERTLARRKQQGRLSPEESDRLFRLGRVAAVAEEVLGTTEKAAGWLRHPNPALGGKTPVRCLDTDLGAQQVETVLGRLAHGVFS